MQGGKIMTERTLNIKVEKRKETVLKISQKTIKGNIKKYIKKEDMSLIYLSKNAHINILILIYMLYCPLSKIRLTNSFEICKALNLQLPKLLE